MQAWKKSPQRGMVSGTAFSLALQRRWRMRSPAALRWPSPLLLHVILFVNMGVVVTLVGQALLAWWRWAGARALGSACCGRAGRPQHAQIRSCT